MEDLTGATTTARDPMLNRRRSYRGPLDDSERGWRHGWSALPGRYSTVHRRMGRRLLFFWLSLARSIILYVHSSKVGRFRVEPLVTHIRHSESTSERDDV